MIIHTVCNDLEHVYIVGKLTEDEQKFFDEWTGGMLAIVNSIEEALDILKRCD